MLIMAESLNFERAMPFEVLISRFQKPDVKGVTIRKARLSATNENASTEPLISSLFIKILHAIIEIASSRTLINNLTLAEMGENSVIQTNSIHKNTNGYM
jgi:hypothetical protein